MKGGIKIVLLAIGIVWVLFSLYGCAITLRPKFAALRPLPPQTKEPSEVVVMTGVPPAGKQYIELGYITVDEGEVPPILRITTSTEDIIEMVLRKAAECGGDAVIKFRMSGEKPFVSDEPARKAEGTVIKYTSE